MNLLFVGTGKGSWEVRGRQIGRAFGARVTTQPTVDDWRWADVAILVKHGIGRWGKEARQCGVRVIWDVLDIWTQPEENGQAVKVLTHDVLNAAAAAGVAHLIGATQAMAADIGGDYIPHHSRPGLTPAPVRDRMTTVVYEGTPKYLGRWKPALEQACKRLGLTFVINPRDLRDADLVVAFRDGKWDGDVCRRWKSGVKYVNAIAAGRPVLTQPCAAFEEIRPIGGRVTEPEKLEGLIFAYRESLEARQLALESCQRLAPEFTLDAMARRYQAVIANVLQEAA